MSNTYCCDLGFNWNAINDNDPNRKGKAAYPTGYGPLQACLMNKANNTPAWFTNFKAGDVLYFVLYDITTLANTKATTVNNPGFAVNIEIQDSTLANTTAPVSPATFDFQGSNVTAINSCTSTAFGGPFPTYVLKGSNNNWGTQYTFNNSGYFELTVTLTVTSGGITRNFIFDPEMIVGPNT